MSVSQVFDLFHWYIILVLFLIYCLESSYFLFRWTIFYYFFASFPFGLWGFSSGRIGTIYVLKWLCFAVFWVMSLHPASPILLLAKAVFSVELTNSFSSMSSGFCVIIDRLSFFSVIIIIYFFAFKYWSIWGIHFTEIHEGKNQWHWVLAVNQKLCYLSII